MTTSLSLYRGSLALLTDLYQLTMAQGYWKLGMQERRANFQLFFRRHPFQGTFALAAGLSELLDYAASFAFDKSDLSYLQGLTGAGGKPLFEEAFLTYLETFSLNCDIDAVPEGTPIFAHEPFVRVEGPLLAAQLLESPLLNIINFQTLIATKASRICFAADPDSVVEFGLRRAQGIDGALSASRAAYIGGCASTSNTLAGKLYGIPVKGTHAHSWVMAFPSEQEAFLQYGQMMPGNMLFLVDTYNSIEGTKRAISVVKGLGADPEAFLGVRLDSGDLSQLSIEIRKLLDEAGFPKALIMASNELDEHLIWDLKHQGCAIDVWGVGTNLVTAKDQPALDGVYKLSALQNSEGQWEPKIKISEQLAKVTNPGRIQVRRFMQGGRCVGDLLYDVGKGLPSLPNGVDPMTPSRTRTFSSDLTSRDLLIPVMREGKIIYATPSLSEIRSYAQKELSCFPKAMRRFLNPSPYFVGLEKSLYETKLSLIEGVM